MRQPWLSLPPSLWLWPLSALSRDGDRLVGSWPDLLIASGRKSAAPAAAVRRRSGGRTFAVQIQNPGLAPDRFDLVVAPRHDRLAGPNVMSTKGSVHGLTRDLLDRAAGRQEAGVAHLERPLVFVAVGGPNRVYRFGAAQARALGRQLAQLPGSLLVTVSRRTGPEATAALRHELDAARSRFWDGAGDNPYRAWLGLADAVVVTSDSVNMATEACITGKPVHVAHLDGGSAKFRAFHALLEHDGHTRPFRNRIDLAWQPAVLDDATAVAARIRRMLRARGLSLPDS